MLTAELINYPANQKPEERHVFTALAELLKSYPAAYAGFFETQAQRRIGHRFNITRTAAGFEIRRAVQLSNEPALAVIATAPAVKTVKPRYRLNRKTGAWALVGAI